LHQETKFIDNFVGFLEIPLIPYDSILVAKSGLGGLMLKTSSKKYIISVGGGKEVMTKINQLRKEAKAK
jgi:hypothetical protein